MKKRTSPWTVIALVAITCLGYNAAAQETSRKTPTKTSLANAVWVKTTTPASGKAIHQIQFITVTGDRVLATEKIADDMMDAKIGNAGPIVITYQLVAKHYEVIEWSRKLPTEAH